jgi:hypothetical protein
MAGPFDYQNTGKVNQYPFTKRQMFNLSNPPCYGINSLDSVFADQVGGFLDIAYNGSIYVAITSSGSVQTSPNLVNWITRTLANYTSVTTNTVVYGNGIFMISGTSNIGTYHNIWTSTDGITWTDRGAISGIVSSTEGVFLSFVNGYFYAVGFSNNAYRGTDGITWSVLPTITGQTNGLVEMINGILFLKAWVYLSTIATQFIYKYFSTDNGATWTTFGFTNAVGIYFYNGVWYALYLNAANIFSYYSSTSLSSGFTLYRTINGPMPSNTNTKQNLGAGSNSATNIIHTGKIYPAVCQILNKVIWVNYYQVYNPSINPYFVTENQVTISDPFSDTIVNDNNKVFSFLASGTELANFNTSASPTSSIIRTSSAVRLITDKFIFIRGGTSYSYVQKIKLPINEYVSL